MSRSGLLFLLLFSYSTQLIAQDLTDIFAGVDTLFMPGAAPGSLIPIREEVTPIVSNSPCEMPRLHYAVATTHERGRVVALAHESILSDGSIDFADNRTFVKNLLAWLKPDAGSILLQPGWVNGNNSGVLQADSRAVGNGFTILNGGINATVLADTDLLILGNDWNGQQAYSSAELMAIEAFVANGGSLLIAGLGWSWPGTLASYPMNQVSQLFGFEFTTQIIWDADFEGSPKMYNFFPGNLEAIQYPYCPAPFVGTYIPRGEYLRVLRLAISTTGEFTSQNGGVAATTELIDQWVATINETYGREYCVRFELISDNDELLFPDPDTDPWATLPPGSGGCTNAGLILNEQFNVFSTFVGADKYDISHVITGAPFGGGCAANLQRGLSGGPFIPVLRHEMGHQFTQSHTINHPGNNNYEPENGGWTIQGGNAHGYAHAVSYHQLANFLRDGIPNVGTRVPTGNTIPSVNAGPDVVIPISTPFELRAQASDPDPNDRLTYVWDHLNRGLPQRIPLTDDAQGALFMRLLPDTNVSRTIPRIEDVIANNPANGQEQLPTQPRILDLRLTVNDNHQIEYNGELVNASGINSDDVQITVADAGPFTVTSQTTPGLGYTAGSELSITWAVNGTNLPPVNTENVSISLSMDGGYTYPFILLASTPNDGSAEVVLPEIMTSAARVKVAAVGNIYFAINPADFEIQSQTVAAKQANDLAAISIVPNPAGDSFQIILPGLMNFRARLFDTRGRLILEQLNQSDFDTTALPEGVYLLQLLDLNQNKEFFRERLLIVR